MSRPMRTPSYRLHKPTGQAVVTLDGHDVYLGKHGTAQSKAEYDRRIAEWLANGRCLPAGRGGGAAAGLSINELMLAYIRHVEGYYVKDGQPTTQQHRIRQALRPVKKLYGHTLAQDFGPRALKAVREKLVAHGYVRRYVNQMIGCVKQMFKWGVAEELVAPSVYHGLQAVAGLLLAHARCLIEERRTLQPAEGFLDISHNEECLQIVADLTTAAQDLESEAHLIRPFHVPREWARFAEYAIICDGQREAFPPYSTFTPEDEQKWEEKVIKPMQKHHADIISAMEALRCRLRRVAPVGQSGRPLKYPKTLALAVRLRRRRKTWPEVWEECKKKSQQVGEPLPRKKSAFLRRVQAYIKAHPK